MGFTCDWRHPDCATGPGPGHFRHVPTHVAAGMPDTPDRYLHQIPLMDVATIEALLSRERLDEALLDRVVRSLPVMAHDAVRREDGPDHASRVRILEQAARLAGRPEVTAGLLADLVRSGLPVTAPYAAAVAASPRTDRTVADVLARRVTDPYDGIAGQVQLQAVRDAAVLPYLRGLLDLLLWGEPFDVACQHADALGRLDRRRWSAARRMARGWAGPPGGFVDAARALG